jgi:hypothetical protein
MRFSLAFAAAAAISLCAAAFAAGPVLVPRVEPIEPPISDPNAGKLAADPVKQLQSRVSKLNKRVQGLEGRVATLEDALREMRARTEFRCLNASTSANAAGDKEDCISFACNYLDGRCRTTASSTNHCAPGFVWDGGSRCVAPPPDGD